MDKNYYSEYYKLERKHWWFLARMEILESLLSTKIRKEDNRGIKILNAGVATGATTTMLEKFGQVTSLEYDEDCCEFLKKIVKIDAVQGSITNLPFEDNAFDLVCAFDVIEHVEDDLLAANEIKRVLKPRGHVFLTVPAFNFLWSDHDVINHHYRRYTLKEICEILRDKNFKVQFKSYFNFFLFFPIALIRIISGFATRQKSLESEHEVKSDFKKFKTNNLANDFFNWLFKNEKWFLNKDMELLHFGRHPVKVYLAVELKINHNVTNTKNIYQRV